MSVEIKIITPNDWDILYHKMPVLLHYFTHIYKDIDEQKWSKLIHDLIEKEEEIRIVLDFIMERATVYSLEDWQIWEKAHPVIQEKK